MRVYRAVFRREAVLTADVPDAVLLLRAEDLEQARRLSADVFEQVYGKPPARVGFALAALDEGG